MMNLKYRLCSRDGMEMVQVAILIAIAVFIGLIFKDKIGKFINDVFGELFRSDF
ncbi:MAG: hypothetical protein GX975_03205 [Clostridiales bacterium]|nr:hypothetical protein [Clostridiales bacterium]